MTAEMKKILIVDDEERIQDIFVRMLVEAGFIVRKAKDARQAINILIRERIDIILLDIRIPQVDGKQIFEIIQEYDPGLKVIVSSVYPIEKQKAIIPFADDYYDKSHDHRILLEKINNISAVLKVQTSKSPDFM